MGWAHISRCIGKVEKVFAVMTWNQVVKYTKGNKSEMAVLFKVSEKTIEAWSRSKRIPWHRQCVAYYISKGKLKPGRRPKRD